MPSSHPFTHANLLGETIVKNYTVERAQDNRDGMAKAIYTRVFSWIFRVVNELLEGNPYVHAESTCHGVEASSTCHGVEQVGCHYPLGHAGYLWV